MAKKKPVADKPVKEIPFKPPIVEVEVGGSVSFLDNGAYQGGVWFKRPDGTRFRDDEGKVIVLSWHSGKMRAVEESLLTFQPTRTD